jgi:predicted nucleic acid-binding protein
VGRLPVVEMIVLDANILIRAVLGRQVRQLLETYAGHGIRFYAPEIAYAEAAKYLPPLLRKKGKSDADLPAALAYLQSLVQPILQDSYGLFEEEARQRLRGRDEEDWPVLAAALALSCAIRVRFRSVSGNRYRVAGSFRHRHKLLAIVRLSSYLS